MARVLKSVNGTVARVNDNGLQVREQPGVWLNVSKYATPRPTIPPLGSEVELGVDTAGFVHEIRLVEAPAATSEHSGTSEAPCATFSLDRASLWVQCLQAAAMHGAGRGEYTDAHVVDLADVWFRRACAVGARKA